MTPLLIRLVGFVVAFVLFCGCALTKDRFRPIPTQGQTREQGLKDQEECNEIALANKGQAAPTSAMPLGVAVGAASGAAAGVALGGAMAAGAVARGAAGAGAGAAAGFLLAAIAEVERRGTEIYVACMQARGYTVGE